MTQYMQAATLRPGENKLLLVSAPVPVPASGEILVEMRASVVNEIDTQTRDGQWTENARVWRQRGPVVTGFEFAGIARTDGTYVKSGDRICGVVHVLDGPRCHAQYICIKESNAGRIPDEISFEEAVSTMGMGVAAAEIFERITSVKAGNSVLILGASGGLGIYSVQYAKMNGANVTAICSKKNEPWVRHMGADQVRNYENDDPLQAGDAFDLIIDCPYKYSFLKVQKFLSSTGMYLTSMPGYDPEGFTLAKRSSQKAGELLVYQTTQQMVESILKLVVSKEIIPAIDSIFTLDRINEAFSKFGKRGKQGRVVLWIGS